MFKYIVKRVLLMIPILLGVILIVFTINRLTPGDPTLTILGADAEPEEYEKLKEELGLNDPFFVQFYDYICGIVTDFDLGMSYTSRRSVSDEILERFPTTLKLGLIGVAITVILGIPFGVISAVKQGRPLDYAVTFTSLFFASMPNFWLALMMMLLFSLHLQLLPASGLASWLGYIMPCLALGLSPVATVARLTRSSMLEVIRQDYIRTARSKGISELQVIVRHALRNALIPVITNIGMQMGRIMAGAVVIENIFNISGIGTLLVKSISTKDYPVVQGCVLFLSLSVCIINLLVDLIYGAVDPRIRSQYMRGSSQKSDRRKQRKEEVAV